MNKISRIITGISLIILGGVFAYFGFCKFFNSWPVFVYGLIFVILGVFILFNKKEDDIEEIKDDKLNK